MKIAIGADHAGWELKEEIKTLLTALGHEPADYGAFNEESVDYPDFGIPVAEAVSTGRAERGIAICGTGIGMSIVANKFRGVRAALCHDLFTARMSREHNDANILIIGGRTTEVGLAKAMVEEWLNTQFQGGRHQRRLEKIKKLEEKNYNPSREK